MTDLEDARLRWIQERPTYEEFARVLVDRIKEAIASLGVWYTLGYRTKELDSLIKKLMRGEDTYDSLPDRVGIRIVVRYRHDVDTIAQGVIESLHCGAIDRKTPQIDVVGYLSTHIDWVRLNDDDPESARFIATRFWAELQIQTQAQHLWSEMSHDGFYKNDQTILALSDDMRRRAHLMAGQIEIADREFARLRGERPVIPEAELFNFLEPLYYRLTSHRPDTQLSLQVLKILLPLFRGKPLEEVEEGLTRFFSQKQEFLSERYRQAQEAEDVNHSPLLFQPEAIVLYERLLNDELELRRAWNTKFPEPILESFANEMGRSFD